MPSFHLNMAAAQCIFFSCKFGCRLIKVHGIMVWGILIGATSAVMQSASYALSRKFVTGHGSPAQLVIYSQLWMGVFGVAAFSASLSFTAIPRSREFFMVLAAFVVAYNAAQYCFFRTVREIEASRAGSLMGLKVILIALISMLLFRERLDFRHAVAVLLTAVSGVGMNFSGARISRRGALFLALTLSGFAATDITGTRLVQLMPGQAVTLEAICVMSLAYVLLGVIAGAAFLRLRFEPRLLVGALPYSAMWFSAMLLLFASFGIIGVVFGSIIQASRGVISVVMGLILAKLGCSVVEPDVAPRLWVRRAVMALLMISAIGLYSAS